MRRLGVMAAVLALVMGLTAPALAGRPLTVDAALTMEFTGQTSSAGTFTLDGDSGTVTGSFRAAAIASEGVGTAASGWRCKRPSHIRCHRLCSAGRMPSGMKSMISISSKP